MCGRYASTLPAQTMEELYRLLNQIETMPRYNIAPTQPVTAIWEQLTDHFVIERKTKRENGKPITRKVLGRILPDTWRALETLEGGSSDDEAVVRDD